MCTNKQKVFLGLYSAWGVLGCKRGYLEYKYIHEQRMKIYLENKSYVEKPEPFYYTTAVMRSLFFGGLVYLIPGFLPVTIKNELKRLEINLRNFEEEKNSPSYYRVL